MVGGVVVVDIPIIIITLHSVELSCIELRVDQWEKEEINNEESWLKWYEDVNNLKLEGINIEQN